MRFDQRHGEPVPARRGRTARTAGSRRARPRPGRHLVNTRDGRLAADRSACGVVDLPARHGVNPSSEHTLRGHQEPGGHEQVGCICTSPRHMEYAYNAVIIGEVLVRPRGPVDRTPRREPRLPTTRPPTTPIPLIRPEHLPRTRHQRHPRNPLPLHRRDHPEPLPDTGPPTRSVNPTPFTGRVIRIPWAAEGDHSPADGSESAVGKSPRRTQRRPASMTRRASRLQYADSTWAPSSGRHRKPVARSRELNPSSPISCAATRD